MKIHLMHKLLVFFVATVLLASCQKEVADTGSGSGTGVTPPAAQKPKVGTTWTYNYTTFYASGGIETIKTLTYRAKEEETLGGEKWLNIVDVATDTTVFKLNSKTGGLFQYTNNSSYLLCKQPAAVNDTYNTFNAGSAEVFTVKSVNDTLATGIGKKPANYYEGVVGGTLIDFIWYNDNAWIVHKILWRKLAPPSTAYFRYSTLYISSIVY